ncbi:hypothetical protein NQ314_003781 [Rhamnusium bicolor]|uniref:Methyltransferase domain-containing protein n=1 Tax=Rhamnusium bicolor TaxID=1586634 RepID=A0AAV8ZLZ4_9CUCU|nr:hypothetical protein NQ314_003781 [Rhamnusium bicolor]
MARICYETALKSNCFYLVDIGSGLGHLSRMLSYGYGFKVCTFEADTSLCVIAKELDNKFEKALKSKSLLHKSTFKTVHVNKRIEPDFQIEDFVKLMKEAFNDSNKNFKFGIVGLHPCGNLGSTLLRLYNECPNATFINISSCCYMKLTLQPSLIAGFPLSNYCKDKNFNLTYLSCEIACHAIENYVERLKTPQNYNMLKIHAYRAALEKIMISLDENLKHSAVCSVKYDESLSFKKYCNKALKHKEIVPSDRITSFYEEIINKTWKNVVVFYSVRLLLAPLVETIILFDRLLYAEECNSYCEILPAFDCNISPRNHVLSARKK